MLYTDGVLDAALPDGERFGEARLQALVERAATTSRRSSPRSTTRSRGLRLRDDIALLAIRCPGAAALLARGTLDGDAEPMLALAIAGGVEAPAAAREALRAALGAGSRHARGPTR